MSNEEQVERSQRFAEKLVREIEGVPGSWFKDPRSNMNILLFSLKGKDCKASFPLSALEDHEEFRARRCKQILQFAVDECLADPVTNTMSQYISLQLSKDFDLGVAEAEKHFVEFFSSIQQDPPESLQVEISRLMFFAFEIALASQVDDRIRRLFHAYYAGWDLGSEYLSVMTDDIASSVESVGRVFAKRLGNTSVIATAATVFWNTFNTVIGHVNRQISAVEDKFGVEYIRPKLGK